MKAIERISVGVIPTFEQTPIRYKIRIDDLLIYESTGQFISGQLQQHQFTLELPCDQHTLTIRIDPTCKQLQVLEIVQIKFDQFDLRKEDLFLKSTYLLDHPRLIDGIETNIVDQCVHLGWAGVYQIKFASPIVPWLLRNF